MPKLPSLTSRQLVKLLKKHGFVEKRQKGSHLIMIHEGLNRQIVVPIHNKALKKGTLAGILRHAEISLDS